jgi:prevent-host-death family protein
MDLVHNIHVKRHRPTTTVNIHEAKTQFSRLLKRVAAGQEIVIARAGQPVARLIPFRQPGTRELGMDSGRVVIAADFDGPLPDAVLADFER